MRRRIFWGVFVAAFVSLLIGIAAAAVIRRQQVMANRAELSRQADVTAELIGSELSAPLRGGTRAAAAQIIRQVRLIGGYDYLEVAVDGPSGIIPIGQGGDLSSQLRLGAVERRLVRQVEVEGEPVFATTRSVAAGDARLLIAFGRAEPLLATGAFAKPIAVGLIVGALLALAISALISRRLGRRLAGLEEAAVNLAGGDFAARASVEGNDDVAELSTTFNYMASSLQQSQRRERDFLMSVGHDLRTPLTTIRGYAEALDAGVIAPQEIPRVAEVLHRQTDRLSRLIEDLMLLARLEAREFTLRPERVDLTAHIVEQVEEHRLRAEKVDVAFRADIRPVGVVFVDPDRVAQVLGNLVDNALRYTPERGSVSVGMTRIGDVVSFEVSDTGPGIDIEDIPRVFERLYVAQRYRPVRPEGSGLGLSIVKELVDAMRGSVVVESRPGSGTKVQVSLPVAEIG